MKKKLVIFLLIVLVAAVFILLLDFFSPQTAAGRRRLVVNGQTVFAELALTAAERNQGLAGREILAADEGMLFVFPDLATRYFWMKGMKFPLDMIWLKGDEVVGFEENVSVSGSGELVPVYISPPAVDRVLEVNAGAVRGWQVKIGDRIQGI